MKKITLKILILVCLFSTSTTLSLATSNEIVVEKVSNNSFGINPLLKPWQIITPKGTFAASPENLKDKITSYITKIAKGTLDTKYWTDYFSEEDLQEGRKLFKGDEKKIGDYLNEYMNGNLLTFHKNRNDLDNLFFQNKKLPFLKLLRPLFEILAFYQQKDLRTNCIGMYYLGWTNELLSEQAETQEEKKLYLDQATDWYGASFFMSRIEEFQNPLYFSNFKIYFSNFQIKDGKSQLELLQSNADLRFYEIPLVA